METPKTLTDAIKHFADLDRCQEYMIAVRWPDGQVKCPRCGSEKVVYLANQRRWKCYGAHPKPQFSVKVGTIFEDSALGLDKWFTAMWLIANCKNGISSYEVARDLGITQKSAWHMLQRVRLAMRAGSFESKMSGHVEIDETFIGGKARFMHKSRRFKVGDTGFVGKVAVMGLLERHGKVRCQIVPNTRRKNLENVIKENIEAGANVYSDNLPSYRQLDAEYIHKVIDHAERYIDGQIHTNGIESFWSLLKRGLKGTYVSVEPFHLFRYLDEQCFRFNNRTLNDSQRFAIVAQQVIGKRLTFAEVTGKTESRQPA
jgi:transposase-like protein